VEIIGAPDDRSVDEEPAMGYRNLQKKRTKDYVARGAPKGRTVGKRRWTQPKLKNGIKDRGAKCQLHLGREKAFIQQDRQAGSRIGASEASSRVFHRAARGE
jgi:hypothetical protein